MEKLLSLDQDFLSEMKIVDWSYTEEDKPKTLEYYKKWVDDGYHGPLKYLSDERKNLRTSIKNFYPEFQSALVFLFDYTSSAKLNLETKDHKFAAYTKGFDGVDYHYWIKDKLEKIKTKLGIDNCLYSIDAQPVLERDLAQRAGLGWFGKNSMLINKKHGSYFLISSIFLDKKLDLGPKSIETDHCGTCTRCIDACPTSAIIEDRKIDASKCISTFTIETFKDNTEPPKGYPSEREEIFGCDICQDVCPWNSKPLLRSELGNYAEFEKTFKNLKLEDISNREYKRVFKGTSLERTGRVGILKNIKYLPR
jgi:epoxyqueuosine reductase